MTTPDLEALAREPIKTLADVLCWIDNMAHATAYYEGKANDDAIEAGDVLRALIRSAPAPGREEIARALYWRELQRAEIAANIAEALTDEPSPPLIEPFDECADQWLGDADAILALFHAPAEAGGGENKGAVRTAGAKLLTALERYGFPVSDAASTAAMSVEARDLHNAARRLKIAITSIMRPADEPAVTNGQ